MKVYNYLELANLEKTDLKLWIKVIKFLKNLWFELWGWIEDKHALEDFYSQPFNPEMITELFEGWEMKKDGDILIFNNNEFPERENEISINPESEIIEFPQFYIPFLPKTLNVFIELCQIAGIELQWRIK